jgi:hypothetical protein
MAPFVPELPMSEPAPPIALKPGSEFRDEHPETASATASHVAYETTKRRRITIVCISEKN